MSRMDVAHMSGDGADWTDVYNDDTGARVERDYLPNAPDALPATAWNASEPVREDDDDEEEDAHVGHKRARDYGDDDGEGDDKEDERCVNGPTETDEVRVMRGAGNGLGGATDEAVNAASAAHAAGGDSVLLHGLLGEDVGMQLDEGDVAEGGRNGHCDE